MNLFDNIIQNSKNNFLGTKPIVPSTPSFTTPQAPRTSSYIAPNTPYSPSKPSMSLFSDEKQMFQKMKADNLSDDTAYSMLKKRRMDILGGNDLANDEKSMLLKMQAGNVPVKQAVEMIKERRKDQFNKKYEEGNLLQKGAYNTLAFAAGNLETLAKYSGNTLDFITGGTMGFGDEVKKMEQVTSSPEFSESSAFTAGTYLPDVALAVSPVGGQYLAGAKGMTGLQGANLFSKIGAKNLTQGLMGRSAVVGAGFGAAQPIFDQGSDATMEDIATGAAVGGALGAVATPVIGKVLKYGQAGYRGGLTGMGKSITRDIKSGVNAITPSGANISTKANRFNANEIREFTKRTGQSPGDFATSRGMTKVGDDAVVEATNLWQKSKDQADEALKAIKGRFRFTDEGEDLLKTTIDDLETRLVNTKSPDYKRISQLKAKYEDTGLTMSEINEIKRAYSNNYKYSFVDAGSESALRSRNLQDAVRKWQFKVAEENGLTNLKEINKTTQGWKMFADSLSKKIQGSSGNNNVSLTDWIALSGGSPENIALYLGKKLASSDTVKSGAIKLFSKKTKPSIIQASKADIQRANFQKDVNRGVSGVGDRSGGKSLVKPVGLLTAPTGKATGAKNVRVNQPVEKSPIKNEGQVGKRPGTTPIVKPNTIKNESVVPKKTVNNPIVKKTMDNDEYFYHGTDPYGFSKIKEEGIIPQRRGVSSLSKTEEYSRNFAFPEATGTKGEMLRVKKDFMKGKLFNTRKQRPKSDEMYEVLTKQTIPPEAIEVLKDGKWQPLIIPPSNAKQSLIKPKSTTTNAFGETINKPSNKKGGFIKIPEIGKKGIIPKELVEEAKKVYDGSYDDLSEGKNLLRGGDEKGRFWTDNEDIAKSFDDYGDLSKKKISFKTPLDVRSLKIQKFLKENSEGIDVDSAINPYRRNIAEFNKLVKWAEDNGFDGIIGKTSDNGMNYLGNEYIPTKINSFYNKSIVKNPLVEEARKYKSAEEFIKAQGEPVYHGTYAYKTSDIKKIKSIIESIYKKNGGEYTQTDINKIANDAKYILENRSKLKVKDEFLLKNLEDELSSKIKKPTIDFAGKSGKDVTDNSLGIYTTPDIDFAKRFTYDIDINPYSGKKTIVQPRQGYVIDMYYKGNTLDLTKGTSKHIDLLSEITGKDKGFISDKLKTKEGTKTIQKLLSSKREILKEKGFNAVKNYAWDDTVKKYKEELAILDDNSIKTKDELTEIYNQSKSIPVKNPLVESSQTQANGPRVIGKMGKVETKTSPKPIVKNLQKTEKSVGDMETKKLIEEAKIKPNSENYSKFTKSASDFISELRKNKGVYESVVSKTNFAGNLKAHDELIEVVKKSTDSKKLNILKEKWVKDLSGKTSPTTAFTIDLLRVIDEQLAKIK